MEEFFENLKLSETFVSEDMESSTTKSISTVKHQMVRSPVNFTKLKCNTDLNVPPTNWLSSSFNSYGLQQALSQSTGFSSFRMAHLFPDCLEEVDVVANAENIKRLLKLPYAPSSTISMMVHRIGNTLLIDDFDVHRFLLQQEDCNWQWLKQFIYEHIITRLNDTNKQSTSRTDAIHQRSLLSKFLYYSLTSNKEAVDVAYPQSVSLSPESGPLLPEPIEDVPDPENTTHTFNRNVVWTFEDIRMLIGTDMAIFGGSKRPCISLRLRDMQQPINVLTGIDYWLDNLMCNVPEVVMCYHLDGLVQKYEIIKTEDLPFLENSKFSPNVIKNVAQNILSFLKQNATKSGHTYWLFKGRNDDVVKLYDLSSLCSTGEFCGNTTQQSNCEEDKEGVSHDNDDKNPFTVPVAMLLYKVARNMKNSIEKIETNAKQAGTIKALLENCVKLLPKEQYPQIVVSSYYLLADLHMPAGIDPNCPHLETDGEDDSEIDIIGSEFGDETNNSPEDSSDENFIDGSIAVQSVVDATKKSNVKWNENSNFQPPPLTGTVNERCSSALQYIVNGLNCLQYFSNSDKERVDIERRAEKIKIIQEEQNPNMAKRYQAIPLPYEKISENSQERKLDVCVQSWNIHLNLLLIEKTCLVYAALTEQEYQQSCYGSVLKFISIAMSCYQIVSKQVTNFLSIGTNYRTNLLTRAGDCYFQCAQQMDKIDDYITQYKTNRSIDLAVMNELKKDLAKLELDDSTEEQIQQPPKNVEQLILMSISCYEMALHCAGGNDSSRSEILSRIGSVRNELGVKYMNWSQENQQQINQASTESPTGDETTIEPLFTSLAKKSYDCLIGGIRIFEEIKDNANLAILSCNMGRFMRFRAHLDEDKEFSFKKMCYENAFSYYQRALTALASKSHLWELVNWELSSAKFTLAKLMTAHYESGMTNEIEQEVIDLLLGSLKLCDTQTRGPRQIMFLKRTGSIYQCLGNIYRSKFIHRAGSKKKLLSLCRLYYERSFKVFVSAEAPFELLGVQIDRLSLQHVLFEGSQNVSQKFKTLHTSLTFVCDSSFIKQLGQLGENCDALETLKQFEGHLQTVLKFFIQISINNKHYEGASLTTLKQIYSISLQSNRSNYVELSQQLQNVLQTIKDHGVVS